LPIPTAWLPWPGNTNARVIKSSPEIINLATR
jgi:hypothetical protein